MNLFRRRSGTFPLSKSKLDNVPEPHVLASGTEGSDDPNNSTASSSGFARISLQQLVATERERLMEQRSAAPPPAAGRRSDVDDEERSELDEADEESLVESAEEVDEDTPHAAKAATTATARRNFNEWRSQLAHTHHRQRQKYASESVALEGDAAMRQRPATATVRRHDSSEAPRGSGSASRHQPPQQQQNGSQRSRSSSSKPKPQHPVRRNPAVEVTMHPTCKVVQDDKMLVLEATVPTLDTVTVETPLFRNGFSLEALTQFAQDVMMRYRNLPFWRYRLYAVGTLLALFFVLPGFLSGLLWGCYVSTIVFLYICVSDPLPVNQVDPAVSHVLMERIQKESAKHEMSRTVYKGWMNIFNDRYSPHTFHVNGVQTVLVRLDGNLLRISRPERAMLKHAFHVDPTLTDPEPRMLAQTIYDLTNAQRGFSMT
ncbi:Protein F55C12.5 c [Aphelenchoides avenae]|nr:Protein F55C12.5 c [Aphelenchus avenae]